MKGTKKKRQKKSLGQIAYEGWTEQYQPQYRPQWMKHLKDEGRERWEYIAQRVLAADKRVAYAV